MARYDFQCPSCNKIKEFEIPMNEYDQKRDSQICDCGCKMNRVFNAPSGIKLCNGMYGIDGKSGWGSK